MHAALLSLALWAAAADPIATPTVLDPRLKIELVAAEPDLVTPTGLAVDARGRVLVVECHTHFRPPNYEGPPADRIRMFEDVDGDGRFEKVTNFFEGTIATMNIGIHPDASVYVATRNEIFRLRDTDDNGVADERTPIVHLETDGFYPHNGLSGFAFDFDGNVIFGLGENLGSKFKLVGKDASLAGDFEGGQVYRCRADGKGLELVAFGFWNPFHVALDAFGRLFAVDNDPDSLPPCRLLHIVPGGNYGYRYRNGRKGVHPFTAWNGELPGTLPMVSGTGEAPSGLVAYESDHLPSDYIGDLLVTSWGDHRIERHRLEPRGASFRSLPEFIVKGDENFRPVGIAVAPDGSVFISDWVLKDYEIHRHGRLWRLSAVKPEVGKRPSEPVKAIHAAHRPLREQAARALAASGEKGLAELVRLAKADSSPRVRAVAIEALSVAGKMDEVRKAARGDADPAVRALAVRRLPSDVDCVDLASPAEAPEVRAEALRRIRASAQQDVLWQSVSDLDAFIAEAARAGLAHAGVVTPKIELQGRAAPERLAALLVLRETGGPEARKAIPRFLEDPDTAVRFAAIQWVGEERLVEYRQLLERAITAGPATSRLFGGYLAALERLEGVVREPSDEWALDQYIVRALDDPKTPPDILRWSLRMLRPDHESLTMERLQQFLESNDARLRIEAVRTLRDGQLPTRSEMLARIAGDGKFDSTLRAEAIMGLSPQDDAQRALLIELAENSDPVLRQESLRSLRGGILSPQERQRLEALGSDDSLRELVERVLRPETPFSRPKPDDLDGWLKLADAGGAAPADAAAGERVFFHRGAAGCARCHQIVGRGARIGPELTATTSQLSKARLVESIVRPSKEIAPHFATWSLVTSSGKPLVGMLVKELATGEQTYVDSNGDLHEFKPGEIEARKPQSTSIMPDGLAAQLTVQEFRDLLAFLRSPAEESR